MLCDACHTKARKSTHHTPDHLLQVSHYVNLRFPGCTTQYCKPSHAAGTPAANQHNLEHVTLRSFRGPYASIFDDMALVVIPPKLTGRLAPAPPLSTDPVAARFLPVTQPRQNFYAGVKDRKLGMQFCRPMCHVLLMVCGTWAHATTLSTVLMPQLSPLKCQQTVTRCNFFELGAYGAAELVLA